MIFIVNLVFLLFAQDVLCESNIMKKEKEGGRAFSGEE